MQVDRRRTRRGDGIHQVGRVGQVGDPRRCAGRCRRRMPARPRPTTGRRRGSRGRRRRRRRRSPRAAPCRRTRPTVTIRGELRSGCASNQTTHTSGWRRTASAIPAAETPQSPPTITNGIAQIGECVGGALAHELHRREPRDAGALLVAGFERHRHLGRRRGGQVAAQRRDAVREAHRPRRRENPATAARARTGESRSHLRPRGRARRRARARGSRASSGPVPTNRPPQRREHERPDDQRRKHPVGHLPSARRAATTLRTIASSTACAV